MLTSGVGNGNIFDGDTIIVYFLTFYGDEIIVYILTFAIEASFVFVYWLNFELSIYIPYLLAPDGNGWFYHCIFSTKTKMYGENGLW